MKTYLFVFLALLCNSFSYSQYWQQRVKYSMDLNVDAATNRFTGKQQLEYTNNSPDTLKKLFYHLYWNAFQPNSMMDARSRHMGEIMTNRRPEWDSRVTDRISKLQEDEIGYQKIESLTMNGVAQPFTVQETILEVNLTKPIYPGAKVTLNMNFNAQVPLQIRRSGRDAANGVKYSMSQWYPKICEYDKDGWHPNPYVAREFYGVWGDYDVKITIDKSFILGATGYLQNGQQIGYGYETEGSKVARPAGSTLTWHFVAPNVHDFVWAADPGYKHLSQKIPNGPVIHVLYKTGNPAQWKEVVDAAVAEYPYIAEHFGAYPYKQYSFIQGGDGGMEYPMATLITSPGLGTVFHEWMHAWYQGMMGTDESRFPWMDEGFANWATDLVSNHYNETVIRKREANTPGARERLDSLNNLLPKYHYNNYATYFYIAKSRLEEPLTTHADHYETNTAYSIAAYSKGCVFLSQLGYIVGEQNLGDIMLEYYRRWRFKHPTDDDFIRVAEDVSGLQLDWYKDYWVNSIKTIDYSIDSLWEEGGKTKIRLKRIGEIPMPQDVMIHYKDGTSELVYIPGYMMFGNKPEEDKNVKRTVFPAWKWTHDTYTFEIPKRIATIKVIELDETKRMADVERRNNRLEIPW
jgi:hypothetical protein